MIARIKLFRNELFLSFLMVVFPLYVTVFIVPDWNWLLFSIFYVAVYIFFVRALSRGLKILVLLFSLLPFLFFDVLLLVNYFIQGSGFNEAFYYHFNEQGIHGYLDKVLILSGIAMVYFLLLCVLTFKLHREKTHGRSGFFACVFIIFTGLISPQSLSFTEMYLEAHDSHPLSEYIARKYTYYDPIVDQLIHDAKLDFTYQSTDKKNLVFIYAESLEANFSDKWLFQGQLNWLDDIEKSSIVFRNMVQTSYTGWTIAGMVASLCGIPLQMPLASSSNNFSLSSEFMLNAECITDLLKKQDYDLSFLGGANLDFAGKKAFLTTHGFDKIVGKKTLKELYPENKQDYNQWGLRDRPLFNLAYQNYIELSAKTDRFGLFLLSLDTHAPGFPDPECTEKYLSIEDNRMLDAVHCSSRLIKEFIQKIRKSRHSNDTVIVVMSDHLAHKSPADDLLKAKPRKLMFMINMPSGKSVEVTTMGTHYDIGPTVLNMIGFPNCQTYGFGHNMLFCGSKQSSIDPRDGLLPTLFDGDKTFGIAAKHSKVKAFVRKKWGNFLGGIDTSGILVENHNYEIIFGNKRFSYRHPNPFKTLQSGALLFRLDRNNYQIKNISSLKDYLELPDKFSIEHWLSNKEDIYLYVGSKTGLPSLDLKQSNAENILALIDIHRKTGTVIPIEDTLKISFEDIAHLIKQTGLQFSSSTELSGSTAFTEANYGVSLLSCSSQYCKSYIEETNLKNHTIKPGLSVWQISKKGKVKKLAHIDHCKDPTGFKNAPTLTSLINTAKKSAQDAVILIAQNKVYCKSKKDMTHWIKPFSLDQLKQIKIKQSYIGIIDLKNNTIIERISDDYVQITI